MLHFLTAKIQDLEGIENKLLDVHTKRCTRLKRKLSFKLDMDAATSQAITTDLTVHGMVPSNAKLLDSSWSQHIR